MTSTVSRHRITPPEDMGGEPMTLELSVRKEAIYVSEPADGFARCVWIETTDNNLVVHCYDQEHEEPITVRISKDGITVETDREGGLDALRKSDG